MATIINRTDFDIDAKELKRLVDEFLSRYNQDSRSVSVILVDDKEITGLNKRFLNKDTTTDVLAFPASGKELGEVIISYPQVKRQAAEYGNYPNYELKFVMVHGLLHLLGWEDYTPEDKERMLKEGERFLDNC